MDPTPERPWNDPAFEVSPAEARDCIAIAPPDTSYSPADEPVSPARRGAVMAALCAIAAAAALLCFCWGMSRADAQLKAWTKVDASSGLAIERMTVAADIEAHLVDPDEHGRAPVFLAQRKAHVITEDGLISLAYSADSDGLKLVDSDEWALVKTSRGGDYLVAFDTAGWGPFQVQVTRRVRGSSPPGLAGVHWELRVPFDKLGKEKGSAGKLAQGDRGVKLAV